MDASFEQKIRQRAYDIWVAAGKDGLAESHWLSAERAVMGEITIPNAEIVKTTKARAVKAAPVYASAITATKKQPAPRRKVKSA